MNSFDNKRIQLFCVPFAGGSKKAFTELADYIDSDVDVVLIEYPGHDSRVQEPFCETMECLVEDVLASLLQQRRTDIPYAILGYSMGSIVTYELVRKLNQNAPMHVFLCANEALSNYTPKVNLTQMSESEAINKIVQMGGIDERILQNPKFLKVFLRPVEADYNILCKYHYIENDIIPDIDCSIFYSEEDTKFEQVKGWNNLFAGKVDFYEFGENHFFIKRYAKEMSTVINKKLSEKVRS